MQGSKRQSTYYIISGRHTRLLQMISISRIWKANAMTSEPPSQWKTSRCVQRTNMKLDSLKKKTLGASPLKNKNSLQKECQGTAVKNSKPKSTGKKQATNKAPPKKKKDQKKKAIDKWAWKSKPPMEMDNKEDNTFVKTFENKKYYWCINHNNSAGMWTLHHPKDCEASKATPHLAANANIAAFDTMDSDSDQEWQLCQSQVLPWFWLAITRNLLWLLLSEDMGMSIAAFFLMSCLIFTLILDCVDTWEQQPYVPKRHRPSKSLWIKYLLKAMNRCISVASTTAGATITSSSPNTQRQGHL